MENSFYIGQKVQVDVSYGIIDECRITKLDSGHPLYSKSMVKVSGIADPVPVELVSPLKGWVTIDGLYKSAREAYMGVSFDPEKRADGIVYDHENELNNDLKTMPAEEQERYIANYKKHLFAWLAAKSRCYSSMIAGPSNFPASQMEKRNITEHNRLQDFLTWREKALKAITKRIDDSKPEEVKINEKVERFKRKIARKIEYQSVANCYSMIERQAYNGEVELVKEALILITEYNETHKRPFMTNRHKVWQLTDIAEKKRQQQAEVIQSKNQEEEINGVKVVRNYAANRLQLFFDGKPTPETITKLKKAAFKWSPSQGCWQRQLTQNAVYAMQQLLK